MNVIASKPLLEGRVKDIDIPSLSREIIDPVARHLQFIRSLPPRCNISCVVGMKSMQNVKNNFAQVLSQEPLTRDQFLKAMDFNK
jgi:aryl-alcohol dehydrogenase-like predicted oxidoreductase